MGWAWFIYRKMELRYWLVHGNVKNNRINKFIRKWVPISSQRCERKDMFCIVRVQS